MLNLVPQQLVRFPFLIRSNKYSLLFYTETTMPSNAPGDSGCGLSAGAIAAIAVAVFTVLILIATLITLCLIKKGEITLFN